MTPLDLLMQDEWFAELHQCTANQGFPEVTKTPAGLSGWMIDPAHLVAHIHQKGIHLRWAHRPEDPRAADMLDTALDILAMNNSRASTWAFEGGFATQRASFLLFSDQPVFDDNHGTHMAMAFCIPGDALNTSHPALPTVARTQPWIDDSGMTDCIELVDPHEEKVLLAMGTLGRGNDLRTIFAPNQGHFILARTWAEHDALDEQTDAASTPSRQPRL